MHGKVGVDGMTQQTAIAFETTTKTNLEAASYILEKKEFDYVFSVVFANVALDFLWLYETAEWG